MNNMFTDGVKRVMQYAREESARLGHNYIGTEHLLLGIIKEGKGKAVTVLTNLGLNLETVKQSVEDYVATSGGTMTKNPEVGFGVVGTNTDKSSLPEVSPTTSSLITATSPITHIPLRGYSSNTTR